MIHFLQNLAIVLLISSTFSCSQANNENIKAEAPKPETKTITGIVLDIEYGKDGYTATVATPAAVTYLALVSISNLGGPDKYSQFHVGETVTVNGNYWTMEGQNHLTVQQIINQQLIADCWLANGPINLYSTPSIAGKNYGKFFQGENLVVLADSTKNNNELWTKVRFSNTVKAGYESQFADGRPMHEGIESMIGWIGGTATRPINCK